MISAESVDILVIVEVKRPTADDRPHADNEVNEYINKSQYVILTDCITWEIHEMNKETRIYYLSKERQRVCERSIPKTKKDRIINWIDNSIPNNDWDELHNAIKEIDAKREDVVIALEAVSDPISLYEPVFSESGDTIYMMDQIGDNNDDRNWLDEIALKEAIIGLDDREKNILRLRFFRGKTQVEVAQEIGISQAQVSRLEKGALGKIKKAL